MSQALCQYNRKVSEITCRENDFVVNRSSPETKKERLELIWNFIGAENEQ